MQKTGFHPVIQSWFEKHFDAPSPPQEQGWPVIARGEHTLILAPTGSGKTLAAFLWSIDHLFRAGLESDPETFSQNDNGIHTLYISPLKALNNDVERNLKKPLKQIASEAAVRHLEMPGMRVAVRTGDTPPHIRQSMLKTPPHILITTPESLYLLLTSERGRLLFRNLRTIIVDEIHSISGNKRGVHLSLSLERLEHLVLQPPVRIGLSATQKPLERIASFLGGAVYHPDKKIHTPRPVTIVDCGQRKDMDLRVISPVPSFQDLPEQSVWPAVYNLLYTLIRRHRTTLIFSNMRAQTEKIARELNERYKRECEDPSAVLARAHHGSISREMRYAIEGELKAGRIPAVVATASLELGIDIGSIDLVVQLESPKSVAAGLQRVGRSGHLLRATSKGRIIPLYQSDLDDACALVMAMKEGDIEPTTIPENALDVLAQQILAETGMKRWGYDDLYQLVKGSYCYRNLSREAYRHVIEMLAGRYADTPLRTLQPRLNWDPVNQTLNALPGSRHIAVLNAGTIPDRAYYRVVLKGTQTNLGEVEEEFVFESRVGQIFFLGNSEWRIDDILQDRIVVTPVSDIKPRAPFWKGDLLFRDYATSRHIAVFRETLQAAIRDKRAEEWLSGTELIDDTIIDNLLDLFRRQPMVATHKTLFLEQFRDPAGEPLILLHSPFGARINAPWAIALSAGLEAFYKSSRPFTYDDDAILIRLPDSQAPFPFDTIFRMEPGQVEHHVITSLSKTLLFAIHFRYNAARSLLLSRSRPGKRIPLWLQRLRASELSQQVREFPDFPVTVETYRECLFDVFDMEALKEVVAQIRSGTIRIKTVQSEKPSPLTSGILFKFLSENMYELDRTDAHDRSAGSSLLDDILSRDRIPRMVHFDRAELLEKRWQRLDDSYKAKDLESLFRVIDELGPLTDEALAARSKSDPGNWIVALRDAGRIRRITAPAEGWVPVQTADLFQRTGDPAVLKILVARYLRSRRPVAVKVLADYFKADARHISDVLQQLKKENQVIDGTLFSDKPDHYWCDTENFKQLYRDALAGQRQRIKPAGNSLFIPFSTAWHAVNQPEQSISGLIERYRGYQFPPDFFEQEILLSRLCPDDPYALSGPVDAFHASIARGDHIVQVMPVEKGGSYRLRFSPRGEGNLFTGTGTIASDSADSDDLRIITFLKENGASLTRDIMDALDLDMTVLRASLRRLIMPGMLTTDTFPALMALLKDTHEPGNKATGGDIIPSAPPWSRRKRPVRRLQPSDFQTGYETVNQLEKARWFLTNAFAVTGKPLLPAERVRRQARLLLQRYGIMVKEWYRHESGLLPWYDLFQELKRMEWEGEIVRGYFIEGLSGIQFALPEAAALLQSLKQDEPDPDTYWLSTQDPALPLGRSIPWNINGVGDNPLSISRLAGNHLLISVGKPLVYSEGYGRRLYRTSYFQEENEALLAERLKIWLRLPAGLVKRKRLEIETIDGRPAGREPLSKTFLQHGFELQDNTLILWPSNV